MTVSEDGKISWDSGVKVEPHNDILLQLGAETEHMGRDYLLYGAFLKQHEQNFASINLSQRKTAVGLGK